MPHPVELQSKWTKLALPEIENIANAILAIDEKVGTAQVVMDVPRREPIEQVE